MSKHTPGPWTAVEHNGPGSGWWTVLQGAWDVSHNGAEHPGVVADAKYSAMTPEENAANAALIAAAPDLKDACEWALLAAAMGDGRTIRLDSAEWQCCEKALRAAIAKAEG